LFRSSLYDTVSKPSTSCAGYGEEACEAGCQDTGFAAAQGNYILALAEQGYDVMWNDIRAELADYVKLKYERGTVAYKAGNAFEMDVPECFDVVLALEIIELWLIQMLGLLGGDPNAHRESDRDYAQRRIQWTCRGTEKTHLLWIGEKIFCYRGHSQGGDGMV